MRKRTATACIASLLLLSRTAAACSPALRLDQYAERAAFYAAIQRPPYVLWAISAAAAIVWPLITSRRSAPPPWSRWITAALFGLAVAQPAWWMDSMKGDCGATRDISAFAVAILSTALVVFGRLRLRAAAMDPHDGRRLTG